MRPRTHLLFALLCALFSAAIGRAHNAPGSSVALDFFRDHVRAELRLPLSELELSFRQPLLTRPALPGQAPTAASAAEIVARIEGQRAALSDYLRAHFRPVASDGRPWIVTVTGLAAAPEEAIPDLVVQLHLQPPPGAPLRKFTLHYDVIVHEVINHITQITVRRDWNHAVFADHPESLTPIRFFNKAMPIDRTGGSVWFGARYRLLATFERLPLLLPALAGVLILLCGIVFRRRVRRIFRSSVALVVLLCCATQVRAHRLDECLQCAFVAVAPDRVGIDLTLAPGLETAPALIAQIDLNRDGAISAAEAERFAQRVAARLSLEIDGRAVGLHLVRHEFPSVADLKTGCALISLDFTTRAGVLTPGFHQARLRNDLEAGSSVYLANLLVPTNPAIRLGRPERDALQQTLAFAFEVSPAPLSASPTPIRSTAPAP